MNELEAKVRAVARRMVAAAMVRSLARCFFYALCLVAALAVTEKLFYTGLPVAEISVGILAAGLPAAVVWTVLLRVSRMKAAVLADQRLGLKERLSSALAVGDSAGPMAGPLREDALRHVRRLDVTRAVPFDLPRETYYTLIPLATALVALSIMPSMDLLGRRARRREARAQQEKISKQADQLDGKIKKLKAVAKEKKFDRLAEAVRKMEMAHEGLKSAKGDRKAAMVQMAKLSDEIRKEHETLQQQLGGLKQKLENIEGFKTDLARGLMEGLKAGDMKKAAEAIKKLQEALKNADLNADQVNAIARELERLAKEMDPKLAAELNERLQAIADALRKLGMDLDNPGNLQGAMDNLAMLDDELMDLEELLEQLRMLEEALAAAQEAKDGLAGLNAEAKEALQKALGMLGGGRPYKGIRPGRAFGPRRMGPREAVEFKNRRAKTQLQKGEILASICFKGQPPKDAQALAKYQDIVGAAIKEADEVLPKTEVPASRKEQIKRYFDLVGGDEQAPQQE